MKLLGSSRQMSFIPACSRASGLLVRAPDLLFIVTIVPLGVLTVLIAYFSLQWRFAHDAPIMLYISFLIDSSGRVPYRDVFDMNMPGAYAAYALVGRLSGYSDPGFRMFDLAYLGAISLSTWFLLKDFGRRTAWCAIVLFALAYLAGGPGMSVQREFLLILPVSAAVLTSFSAGRLDGGVRAAAVGFLFGLAATIKPQAAIGAPVVLGLCLLDEKHRGCSLAKFFLASLAGLAVPVLLALAFLWQRGALPYFFDIALNYWPLYGGITGEHSTIYGWSRVIYLIDGFVSLNGKAGWIAPAALGAYVALFNSSSNSVLKRRVLVLSGMTAAYSIYPVLQGQFWEYHYLLFVYFVITLGSLCFTDQSPEAGRARQVFPVMVIVLSVFLLTQTPAVFWRQLGGLGVYPPKHGRVDEIAAYLKAHLEQGDRVQPLDWTGGAVHAMLISRAQIATPFVYDFHFYHHVSSTYIQGLRGRFLAGLQAEKPRFIVSIETDKPWVSGVDTTRDFPALSELLSAEYRVVRAGEGYFIYERARLPNGVSGQDQAPSAQEAPNE
ncbi:MAG: hypothetical protein HYY30_05380 [Chloroflexi bacterium]|nr:hypothetical protein [Chloroflexota bacterium]